MQNRNFYNSLSFIYDDMIDFGSALKRRIDLLSNIAGDHKTAADFGCGTGIDSIALSKLGLRVHAFDQSGEMIAQAKVNASKYDADIQFFCSPLENVISSGKYDLIVSLGNTLANLDEVKLRKAAGICSSLLNDDGQVVIQLLNYNLIGDSIHIINETENSKYHVTRYYEKAGEDLLFKIKIIDKEKVTHNLIETIVYPHPPELITQICDDTGLRVDFFGGLDLCGFDFNKSKDLVGIAERK